MQVFCGSSDVLPLGNAEVSNNMYPQYMDGEIKIDEYITHHYDLKDINEAFHVLHKGERYLVPCVFFFHYAQQSPVCGSLALRCPFLSQHPLHHQHVALNFPKRNTPTILSLSFCPCHGVGTPTNSIEWSLCQYSFSSHPSTLIPIH